jgi:antitoxin component YwqK of YwqJK toxin-antitoxin module
VGIIPKPIGMKPFQFFLLSLLLKAGAIFAQGGDTLNQTDASGLKQGYWVVSNTGKVIPGCAEGQKLEEGRYVNNKKIGTWKTYHCNGRVKSEMNYREDRSATAKIYYESGILREEGTWKNNTWVGGYKYYYENGKPFYDFAFNQEGKREGKQTYFHPNGNTMYEGTWMDSKEAGIIREYHEDGSLKSEKNFQNGVLDEASVKNYEPKPQPKKEKVEEPTPKEVKEPLIQAPVDNTLSDGMHKTYHGGKLERDGEFKGGKFFRGKHFFYDKDGELLKTVYYDDGKPSKTVYAKDDPASKKK